MGHVAVHFKVYHRMALGALSDFGRHVGIISSKSGLSFQIAQTFQVVSCDFTVGWVLLPKFRSGYLVRRDTLVLRLISVSNKYKYIMHNASLPHQLPRAETRDARISSWQEVAIKHLPLPNTTTSFLLPLHLNLPSLTSIEPCILEHSVQDSPFSTFLLISTQPCSSNSPNRPHVMSSQDIRLRLTIRRHALPEVKLIWPCTASEDLTIAKLLSSVNDVVPLEGEQWGLEDYSVELNDGQGGGSFECLHFQQVRQVLKHDDQVL